MNIRALASNIIGQVVQGASLTAALAQVQLKDPRDQALLQAICYGVCRWYFRLDAILKLLLEKPLKEKDHDIHCLMLVGLYQLIDMRIPAHAAVAETVAATKQLKKIWAKGLVNAVLRQYQRQTHDINKKIQATHQGVYAHPQWMIDMIAQDWPHDWQDILMANNQHPPFSLRVNQRNQLRDAYLEKLNQEKIEAYSIPETSAGVQLKEPLDVQQLPGFMHGDVSVQDGAAQLAAELLGALEKENILDACAAPGGKTTHILELTPQLNKLIAIDRDETRINSIKENLQRLNLSAEVVCADACAQETWWDGTLFDRILLDAPCSASGVIRRHPDIKLLRREEDILALTEKQQQLLNSLWAMLKPGGLLVYVTCSVFLRENTRVLESFLASTANVKEEKIKMSWGKECPIGRQILTGMHGMDGFYFACLRKC